MPEHIVKVTNKYELEGPPPSVVGAQFKIVKDAPANFKPKLKPNYRCKKHGWTEPTEGPGVMAMAFEKATK